MPSHDQERRLRVGLDTMQLEDQRRSSTVAFDRAAMDVLSAAGTIRYIAGASSKQGRRMADLMETVRQRRRTSMPPEVEADRAPVQHLDEGLDIPF